MRLDKWLKVTRVIKRRGTAKDLCLDGDVKINDKVVKPMHEVRVGDVVELRLGSRVLRIEVHEVKPFAKKEDADAMYAILEDRKEI